MRAERRFVAALVIAGLAGCSGEDVVVADVAPDAAPDAAAIDVRPEGGEPPCHSNFECAANELCNKHDCSDRPGQCELRPLMCDPTPAAVCGCDGVTYWNDCIRRQSGAASSHMGECTSAPPCDESAPCPDGTHCARLLPMGASCLPPPPPGTCWALPPACPGPAPGERWSPCGPIPGCVTTCDAIRAEKAFRMVPGLGPGPGPGPGCP